MAILFSLPDSRNRVTNPTKTMTIRKIIGEHGPQAELCSGNQCPAAILTTGDAAFVQGYRLKEEERAALTAPDGEDFVAIPLPVLKRIAAEVLNA